MSEPTTTQRYILRRNPDNELILEIWDTVRDKEVAAPEYPADDWRATVDYLQAIVRMLNAQEETT